MLPCDLLTLEGILKFAEDKLNNSKSAAKFELDKALKENIPERLEELDKSPHHLHLRYSKTSTDRPYEIYLELQRNDGQSSEEPPYWAVVTCTCPAAGKKAICKHGMAALLYCLPESERPGTFAGPGSPSTGLGGGKLSANPEASPAKEASKRVTTPLAARLIRSGRRIMPNSFIISLKTPQAE